MWTDKGDVLVFTHNVVANVKKRYPCASFDLDRTLVEPKSGKKFPRDADDWKFMENVEKKLKSEIISGKKLVIFTNQGWNDEKKIEQYKKRLESIHECLGKPEIIVLAATRSHSKYRKPSSLMLKCLCENYFKVEMSHSFYVGDAAGRSNDHSDTDRTFAMNSGLSFYTPEMYFLGQDDEQYTLKVDFTKLEKEDEGEDYSFTPLDKEVIICVGMPGSGKSQFVKRYLKHLGYTHINQDTLKTKDKCLKTLDAQLKKNDKHIVIDNTNPSSTTRAEYINIVQKYKVPVRVLFFNTPPDVCKHNNAYRESLGERDRVPEIAYRIYQKNFIEPTESEGCREVITIPFKVQKDTPEEYYTYFL